MPLGAPLAALSRAAEPRSVGPREEPRSATHGGLPTIKDRILDALRDLPADATYEEAIERLVFLAKVDEG